MAKDKEQAKRFEAAAREAGSDETGAAFEKAFAKVMPPKLRPATEPKGGKSSR